VDDITRQRGWADMLQMVCHAYEDYIWRIQMHPDRSIVMSYIGYCPIDTPRRVEYPTIEDIPEWVKDRLAVLNMMPPNPTDSVVFGVGRRVDASTWWVVEPAEERLRGTDAGS
jgi:hypothetical protein